MPSSSRSSSSASFKSFPNSRAPSPNLPAHIESAISTETNVGDPTRLTPAEESALRSESLALKTTANSHFVQSDFTSALSGYDKALASLPTYLDYEIAVLKSNIAACQLKLQEWKAAEIAGSESLECLDRLDPPLKKSKTEEGDEATGVTTNAQGEAIVEEIDDETAEAIESLEQRTGHTRAEVQKIRVKARLRRARAREGMGGWQALEGANEDYQELLRIDSELSDLDKKSVKRALVNLPPRLEEAKQREMGEMMGKLKELGNGILKPFGLSTNNFKFEKQEGGGYSMQFDQNAKR